jgi:pimeloyl-ACP methyl ester carboxylesterase
MSFGKKLLTAGLVAGGALGALATLNKLTEAMAGELDTVLTGEERRYPWKYGDMFYEVKGNRSAQPLLLIHGLSVGASSYEWRKNVDVLAQQFRVYALDLLGFGLSDHPAIDYTPETFTDLISDFVREVIGKPTVVVAHGLACAYVVVCAHRRPQLFEHLVLVEPSATMLQEMYISPLHSLWKAVLRLPIIGTSIYNIFSSRQAIRRIYNEQGYYNPNLISDEMVEYVYTSAHQSNARYALSSLLSNHLTLDAYEPFASLQMPIVALWGSEGHMPSETSAAFKRVNPQIEVRILDKSGYQLQEEQAASFNSLVQEFAATAVKPQK